jgi:hypothetical protein
MMLAGIDLTHRRVLNISRYAEKLTEQMDRLTNVAIDEAN